jgi:hypothetical protein
LASEADQPQGAAIASDGDLTAVLFEDEAHQTVHVAVSDGRGLEFSTPVRIDSDGGGHEKVTGLVVGTSSVLAVRGQAIYATWIDERNAGSGGAGGIEARDVYFARSLDGGTTWGPDQPVPKGHPPGGASPVQHYDMAVDATGQHVYVLQSVDPAFFGGTTTELWLAASHDGGASFGPALRLVPSSLFQDTLAITLDGDQLHVAFVGQLATTPGYSPDVFHLVSEDGGATFSAPLQLDPSGAGVLIADNEIALAANGGTVAVAWAQAADLGAFLQDLYAAVSVDGGATFGPSLRVGSEPPGTVYLGHFTIAVDADSHGILAWEDDRNGTSVTEASMFVARTIDGGASWLPEVELSQPSFSTSNPQLVADGLDLTLLWMRNGGFESAFSRDGGAAWSTPEILISQDHPSADFIAAPLAYNTRYQNALVAWAGTAPTGIDVFAGGYRLPECVPSGFVAGGQAHVALDSFSGDAPLAWVVFAASTGDLILPFGDGRNLGLALDGLLLASLANPALLLVPLAPDGSGATPSFPLPLSSGTTVYAAAVSLSLGSAVVLDELTDVVEIAVQ